MLNTPFSPWPSFSLEEAKIAHDILISGKVNYWTGSQCREFEAEFASWVGASHSISLANGTLAIELALKALGVGAGDEVIVTPRTFIASVSSVVNVGATPVFADVDMNSGNITAGTISKVITSKTKAIICVHLAGWPCDMDPIIELAQHFELKVIEDCAQAHGARYKGRSVGTIGDIGAWSFCQDKIISTAGEGGMVTTNSKALWSKMWAYKDHGKSHDLMYEKQLKPGFRWVHESFGSNYRMTEIQGAVGRLQLKKMSQWTAARNANARKILDVASRFSGLRGGVRAPQLTCKSCADLEVFECQNSCVHAYYKLYIYVSEKNLVAGWSRDRILEEINKAGVPCYSGSCSEVYLESAFLGHSFGPVTRLQVAKILGETSLMFLVHPTLTKEELEKTCLTLEDVLSIAVSGGQ